VPRSTRAEVGGNHGGSPTFDDPWTLAHHGPRNVGFSEPVEVKCKVYAPSIPSATPDGYWYLLASSPWNSHYYAVANTFTNGDQLGDPNGTHHTDLAVPDCAT
jgi:hypothetical protein